jgi:hypothetical protein
MRLPANAHPKSHPGHSRAVAPEAGYHITSDGQQIKSGPASPFHVGPDTVIILSNPHNHPDRMPRRAIDHMRQHGKLPDELTKKATNQHPGHVVKQLANAAHRELPGGAAPPPTNALPMAGI